MGYPLTSDFTAINQKELLSWLYGLSENPSRSTIREWMTQSGFHIQKEKRYFVDMHESKANRCTPLGTINEYFGNSSLLAQHGKGQKVSMQ
jgi:hypothetical protein